MSDVSKTNDMLGFIDQTLYANEGGGWFWTNAEVIKLLHEIRAIATRVPVQGESNDDSGKALSFRALTLMVQGALDCDLESYDDYKGGGFGCSEHEADGTEGGYCAHAELIAEKLYKSIPALSRATVPDAATDAGRWHLLYEKGVEERVELRAERDAAVAAIERVRDTHQPCLGCETAHCFPCYSDWPCSTFAALDGAPEPEVVEWAYAVGHRNSDGSYSSEADYDDDEITDDIDEARAWVDEALDSGTYSNAILVKRAPMPSWLPVEGESKP